MADSKALRRYQAGVERALALFDSTNEWADYIAFLSRLLKSIQDPPPDAEIPLKRTVARHLAQCLKSSLPSGVHQKALDVYTLIFSILGQAGLSKELPLYFPGISHTLAFASLATRPQILSLYDDHILALPVATLRPALRALILSLLPAIEEETSEDFDQILRTFNKLRAKFTDELHEEIFWQNFFLASITSANRRAGVLVYLTRYLPRLMPRDNQNALQNGHHHSASTAAITTPEPGLLVRCFATGLQDEQPLIQRGFLDLLVSHLPLNAAIFSDRSHATDVDVLVTAATTVVLRRDMGFNRRLWAWFTGSEIKPTSDHEADKELSASSPTVHTASKRDTSYFTDYALEPLVRSLHEALRNLDFEASSQARPFRIALSLMDRWEIGGPVVEAIFVPLVRNLQLYQSNAPSQNAFDEVFRSANVFFDGVEGRLIASQMIKLIQADDLDLVQFLVTNFNLEDDEMMKRHMPLICLFVTDKLLKTINEEGSAASTKVMKLSQILQDLLDLTASDVLEDVEPFVDDNVWNSWIPQVMRYYEKDAGSTKSIMLPLSRSTLAAMLSQQIYGIFLWSLSDVATDAALLGSLAVCAERCIALTRGYATIRRTMFVQKLLQSFDEPSTSKVRHFQMSVSIVKILEMLRTHDFKEEALSTGALVEFISPIVCRLWDLLQSSSPQFHVEAVESIWHLYLLTRELSLVESTVLSLTIATYSDKSNDNDGILRFAALWAHSKTVNKQLAGGRLHDENDEDALEVLGSSLLFLVDKLDRNYLDRPVPQWMHSLSSLTPIFQVVLHDSLDLHINQQALSLVLERIKKLISVAKGSPAQWTRFLEDENQSSAILELCYSILSKQPFAEALAVEALETVRLMVENGLQSVRKDLVQQLFLQLAKTYHMYDLQDALLSTLQVMVSALTQIADVNSMIPILLEGISAPATDLQVDKWVTLLCNIVPSLTASALMASLLKMTGVLCKRIESYFAIIQNSYGYTNDNVTDQEPATKPLAAHPERSISNLLSGMEYILARAHQQASVRPQKDVTGANGSHVDLPSSRSIANDHLTVVLCMQDALKTCTTLSLWRATTRGPNMTSDAKSLHHMSSKLRTKSRRFLENLIDAEPQECLETLMGLWVERRTSNAQPGQILELLQTLDGARPKFMMPATFNAIYNRTNPAALDSSQRSSLSVNINALELIAFLNDYTDALEDDLLDEIWTDCSTFLKEVLSNPMPHRQILLKLLEFTGVLCRKMENTNFGDESRTRRELADLCARLFTAIFTIKPAGLDASGSKASEVDAVFNRHGRSRMSQLRPGNALQILQETLPDLSSVLNQSDRLVAVYNGIAIHMTGPLLHSKLFPQNASPELLALLQAMSLAPSATKAWRKDVTDAFNDSKFFQNSVQLVEPGWLPLVRQLALIDKTLMPDLLTRLVPPAAAGLMFGVGATAARTEADRRAQATLKRIALLLLCMEQDSFVPQLQQLLLKLEELLTATPESSPSSATKSDIYMVLRAVLLSFSQSQLDTLWPLADNELRDLCTEMISRESNKFTLTSKLQGAKLLDLLLLLKPDEFQLHEWLFVTDTVDAIYPPDDMPPMALADQIGATTTNHQIEVSRTNTQTRSKKPWLCTDDSRDTEQAERLLAGFFSQLSIRAFEDNYSLQKVDMKACRQDLLADLFHDG